ncbi:MAG: hypothetical protein ABIH04_01615, partial [Planctomycetota bacterium]
MRSPLIAFFVLVLLAAFCVSCATDRKTDTVPTPVPDLPRQIVIAPDAHPLEALAARELQRFIYQMDGVLLPVANSIPPRTPSFILASNPSISAFGNLIPQGDGKPPADGEHRLLKVEARDAQHLVLLGRQPADVLHAVYSVLEDYGYGFFLGGDAVPAGKKLEFPRPAARRPVFKVRGIMPLAGGPSSRIAWNDDDYRACFDQIAKMRCNLVAFHFSDDEPFAAYRDGNAFRGGEGPADGGNTTPVKDFAFGTSKYFSEKIFASDVAARAGGGGEAIRAAQIMLQRSLYSASCRGLQTCIGFDVSGDPTAGGDIDAFLKRVEHLLETCPTVNYLCLWPEELTADERKAATANASARLRFYADTYGKDFEGLSRSEMICDALPPALFASIANHYIKERAPHVRLVVAALSGKAAAGLDKILPGDVIIATPDTLSGSTREWWKVITADEGAVPFLPSGSAAEILEECRDAHENSAVGVIFAHYRTRAVEPQAAAFARFCWDAEMTEEEFFADFAVRNFGPETGPGLAPSLRKLDALLCQAPGRNFTTGSENDGKGLTAIRSNLLDARGVLVERNEARPVERLDHILHGIEWALAYDAAAGIIDSPQYRKAEKAIENAKTDDEKKKYAGELVELLKACPLARGAAHCAASVSSRSELGELAELNRTIIADFRRRLEPAGKILGKDVFAEIARDFAQRGVFPFYSVSVQNLLSPSIIEGGEDFLCRAIIPHKGPLARAEIAYRNAGAVNYNRVPLRHAGGYVYEGAIKTGEEGGVVEYYIVADSEQGAVATWPLNAPVNTASITVLPRAGYTALVVSNEAEAALRRDYRIEAVALSETDRRPSEVVLNFRKAGENEYNKARMENAYSNVFHAVLPAKLLD